MLSSALGLVSGPLKNMLDQLCGQKNELWLEIYGLMSRMTPENILKALKGAVLKPWKKLSIGGHTKEELLEQFKMATCKVGNEESIGIQVTEDAYYIASKPECMFSEKEDHVEFFMESLEVLFGFEEDVDAKVFLNEAFLSLYNLELCKPSDAFYIRRSIDNQPSGEWLRVGMTPIVDSSGYSKVFSVEHDDDTDYGVCVSTDCTDDEFYPGSVWFFRRKKTQA